MIRAVFDSNVVVSGLTGEVNSTSAPGELIRRWRRDEFELAISQHILAEVRRALSSPFYQDKFTPPWIAGALETLQRQALLVPMRSLVSGVATHPEDDRVLASAVSARADFLVTGDKQLRKLRHYQGVSICTPREFLTILEQSLSVPDE